MNEYNTIQMSEYNTIQMSEYNTIQMSEYNAIGKTSILTKFLRTRAQQCIKP